MKIRHQHENKDTSSSNPWAIYYLKRENSSRGKFVFSPLGNGNEAFYTCVCVSGGGGGRGMDKGEDHLKIIPHKLVLYFF